MGWLKRLLARRRPPPPEHRADWPDEWLELPVVEPEWRQPRGPLPPFQAGGMPANAAEYARENARFAEGAGGKED